MIPAPSVDFAVAADSAHVVAAVYTTSLLVTVPLAIGALAALGLRRSHAAARVLVWRSSLVAMLLIFIGQQLPADGFSWGIPSTLATPLVALGRARMSAAPGAPTSGDALSHWVLVMYLAGLLVVSATTLAGVWRMRRVIRSGHTLRDAHWTRALIDARRALGVDRGVDLIVSSDVLVPMTWRAVRPVIVLPASAVDWAGERRRIVLMHELAHVKAFDAAFNLFGRGACALFWFHPAAWWVVRRMREDAEFAADARVVAAGVRRSDYAEILMDAADRFLPLAPTFAWSRRSGLRSRLAVLLDKTRTVAPLGRSWVVGAAMGTMVIGVPTSAVRLAPTRAVLTTLIGDARWESRAYAVIGLANRRDTVAVAREIAEQDPNPRVREWARYALRQQPDSAALRSILQ